MAAGSLYSVGDKWYYTPSTWKATVGPFNTLQEASEALQKELADQNGKKESSGEEFVE
jgi:hypothetical protein